jgi:hypothetical protein
MGKKKKSNKIIPTVDDESIDWILEFRNGIFTMNLNSKNSLDHNAILKFIQTLIPLYSIVALKEKEKEATFAKKVHAFIYTNNPKVEFNHALIFNKDSEKTRRFIDLFYENTEYLLGKTIYQKPSIDTTITTWNVINQIPFENSDISKPKRMISIYNGEIQLSYYDVLKSYGPVFCFQTEKKKIVDIFA